MFTSCDRCPARAAHVWSCPSSSHVLLGCTHHSREWTGRLLHDGWTCQVLEPVAG